MFTTEGSNRSFNHDIKSLIRQGQNGKVKNHIKGMAATDLVDSTKTSLLHLAAKYNNIDLTMHLIKIKCNVNAKNNSKTTPLMIAAMSSSFKTAQKLIEAKADLYAKNSSNKSTLQLLLNNKKIPQYLVKICLEKVKSGSSTDKIIAKRLHAAKCPLNIVIYLKKPNVTKMIINHYGQIDSQQSCAAMDLALKRRDQNNVSVLLECGVEVDINKEGALLFLHNICIPLDQRKADLSLIDTFLGKVSNWNSLQQEALYWLGSLFKNSTKLVLDLFLQHGVNDYVKKLFPGHDLYIDLYGNSKSDIKEMLKNLNFDINSHGQEGFTALHCAVQRGDLSLVLGLINAGANPNVKDIYRRVPLQLVFPTIFCPYNSPIEQYLDSNERKMIELLLQCGADPMMELQAIPDMPWYQCSKIKMQLILPHLAILGSQDTAMEETIRNQIDKSPNLMRIYNPMDLYNTCRQQIESLKALRIYGSVTLNTILISNPEEIGGRLRDRKTLETIMQSDCVKQLHFYYASKLQNSVNKIFQIMDLREKACMIICESTGLLTSHYIILEKILSFFTYKDLLIFE